MQTNQLRGRSAGVLVLEVYLTPEAEKPINLIDKTTLTVSCLYSLKCTKFGRLTLGKIIKIIAIR